MYTDIINCPNDNWNAMSCESHADMMRHAQDCIEVRITISPDRYDLQLSPESTGHVVLNRAILVECSTLNQRCGAPDDSERDVHVVSHRSQSVSGLKHRLGPNPLCCFRPAVLFKPCTHMLCLSIGRACSHPDCVLEPGIHNN